MNLYHLSNFLLFSLLPRSRLRNLPICPLRPSAINRAFCPSRLRVVPHISPTSPRHFLHGYLEGKTLRVIQAQDLRRNCDEEIFFQSYHLQNLPQQQFSALLIVDREICFSSNCFFVRFFCKYWRFI